MNSYPIVSRSSPENSRPEARGLLFSNNPNQRDKLSLKASRSSTENSRLEACYFPITWIMDALLLSKNKYFDLFCKAKYLNFLNFQYSGWIRRYSVSFEKFRYLKKILTVSSHFVWQNLLILKFPFFWMNQKVLVFWKNSKCFDPFCMGKK